MSDKHFKNKAMLGMKVYKYAGCGICPKNATDCRKTLNSATATLKNINAEYWEYWDNWRRMVKVFSEGDLVEVDILHDGKVIYCGSAESTKYDGVRDYIDLENFEEP